jgi:protein SDA1
LFFKLFRIKDKKLRSVLYHHIVNDIRRLNSRRRDEKVNRALQNFMYTMLQDSTKIAARKSLEVMIELFKTNVWRDSKTVNVISTAVFSNDPKMVLATINFFLNPPNESDDAGEDKEYRYSKRDIIKKFGHGVIKKTTKRKRKMKEALAELSGKRKTQLKNRMDDRRNFNYAAVMMINDPQGYAEKVYRVLLKSSDRFETKIMLMALLSRFIASHQLVLLDFYSFMQRYLAPHQPHITNMMAIAAQSCHSMVTPEAIEPLLKTIAFNFISDRRSNEAIVVGLNTVREICLRCPLVMTEPLLHDLLEYRHNHDKGISMAAKSILSLFRVLDPQMLPKKLRGKTDAVGQMEAFGEHKPSKQIEGTDLLEAYRQGLITADLQSEDDASDISGEWIDVSSGEDSFDINVSDDDSEADSEEAANKASSSNGMDVSGEEEDSKKKQKQKKLKTTEEMNVDEDEDGAVENQGWETASDDPEEFMRMVEEGELAGSGSEDEDEDGEEDGESGDSDMEANGDWVEVGSDDEDGSGSGSDEEEGEWVTASSDSEEDDDTEHRIDQEALSADGRSTTASERLESVQLLSDEDFALIEKLKKAQAEGKLQEVIKEEVSKKKRPHEYITKLQDMRDEDIDVSVIEGFRKKARLDKAGRVALMKETRDERLKELDKHRSSRKSHLKTNEAKKKNKAFMMIKHSKKVQRKKTRSQADSSRIKTATVKNLKKMDKSFKAKILRK